MLKADQAHSTIASGLNRRGVLIGGSVIAFPRQQALNPFVARLFLEGGAHG
jgi:hypothetical protein